MATAIRDGETPELPAAEVQVDELLGRANVAVDGKVEDGKSDPTNYMYHRREPHPCTKIAATR